MYIPFYISKFPFLNLISSLIYHSFYICPSYFSLCHKITLIKAFKSKNSYPKHLLYSITRSFLDRQFTRKPKFPTVLKKLLSLRLPFLGHFSLQFKRKLTRLNGKAYPHIDDRFVFFKSISLSPFFPSRIRRLPLVVL